MPGIARLLRARSCTLSVAESCTAGGLGWALTRVPGSSDYFVGGVQAYADSVKRDILGVPEDILRKHGAVSKETAKLMAEQVQSMFGTTIGIAITGIAGPGGGTLKKPVGTVWFGIAGPAGSGAEERRFDGRRAGIRRQAVRHALEMIEEYLYRGIRENG